VTSEIPSVESTASINNLQVTASSGMYMHRPKGNVYHITFRPYRRTGTVTGDTWGTFDLASIPIGRYAATSNFSSSTSQVEYFQDEDYRWKSSTFANESFLETQRDFSYFTTPANIDYDSRVSILSTNDLQCLPNGHMLFPTASFNDYGAEAYRVVYPSQISYTGATGSSEDRYYFRAFFIGDLASHNTFKLKIETSQNDGLETTDIYADPNEEIPYDDRDVRIDFRLPGPVNTAYQGNNATYPGTKWGVLTGGGDLSSGTNPKYEDFNGLFSYSGPGDNDTVNQHHFIGNFGQPSTSESDGIILFRIRFKAGATGSRHHITKLELET
jgi:hypothetical protein